MALELPSGNIHLWLAYPDEIDDQALLLDYAQLLDDDENTRWHRFYFAKHRHQYLVTRALVRSTLTRYADIDPKEWRFAINHYGKPEIANALPGLPLRFNLTHTDGLVICAIVLADDIGVDCENVQKNHSLAIAEHCFSTQEIQALKQLPENRQAQRFLEYWTLKEAYIKAKGMGLSLPLDQFSFRFRENQRVEIHFDQHLDDHPEHWQFWQFNPSADHIAAVAVKSVPYKPFQLTMNTVVPLQNTPKLIDNGFNRHISPSGKPL
jgi:4'-phosphopantetheinyl transferase